MRAEVATHYDGEPRVIPVPDGDGLWIETKLVAPPSLAGRSVDVFVSRDMVTKMFKEFRSSGIRARRRHEGSAQ